MIVVSACLCGINCKYNGKNNLSEKVKKLVEEGKAVSICPEKLGGLPTPRKSSEIVENKSELKVITIEGKDVTEKFLLGARKALAITKSVGAKKAILKSGSPSCGVNGIYDGTFSKKLVKGNGITARLFLENGIEVISEKDI